MSSVVNTPDTPSVGNRIYSGAVEFERIKTLIFAIIATVIGVCAMIFTVPMIFKKDTITTETNATVIKSICSQTISGSGNNTRITYTCSLTLNYTVNGNVYTQSLTVNHPISYVEGSVIKIKYNPNNPNEISEKGLSTSSTGIIFTCIALCIIISGWIWWYMTRKYEAFAAFQAVSDVSSAIRGR